MPERCGSLHNHTDGETRGCVLDRGHNVNWQGEGHISADRVRWSRHTEVVRLGLGARVSDVCLVIGGERVPLQGDIIGHIGDGHDVEVANG